jgi:hypothetical protein
LKPSFEIHNIGIKHFENVKKCNKFACNFCGLVFDARYKKVYHMKNCKNKDKPIKIRLKKQDRAKNKQTLILEKLVDDVASIKNNSDITKVAMETSRVAMETSVETSKLARKSMTMMKYASVYLKDAPPLTMLNKEEVYDMIDYEHVVMEDEYIDVIVETSDSDTSQKKRIEKQKVIKLDESLAKYIRPVLNNFENKTLSSFFGKMIAKYYNKCKKKFRKFWTADVSRLSFIIMQVVNRKGEKEWIQDKSGKKFTDLVITPMFDALSELIHKYIDNIQEYSSANYRILKPIERDRYMEHGSLCLKLLQAIKYEKNNDSILKFIAPFFNFDSMRLDDEPQKSSSSDYDSDDDSDDDSDSESSSEESPKKPIRKITKKS